HQGATPMVVFLGQISANRMGTSHLQEMDFGLTFRDMAKRVEQVNDPDRIAEVVTRAFHIATSGTPGPVVVALPTDVLEMESKATPMGPRAAVPPMPSDADVEAIADILSSAERPVMLCGGLTKPA